MNKSFETERLVVFVAKDLKISEKFPVPRELYVAFGKDEAVTHCAMPVVTCLVGHWGFVLGENNVDWLETASEYRRHGFATEFWKGLLRHLGSLDADAGTDAGAAFLRSVGRQPFFDETQESA